MKMLILYEFKIFQMFKDLFSQIKTWFSWRTASINRFLMLIQKQWKLI